VITAHMLCIRTQLYRLRKKSLDEGHGFSRAVTNNSYEGFSP
jgi:hypothetical protein